ncbi:cysteine desulfurase family protein [Pseudorhodoplanes sp.]|uniref:cysteine desulfurase family protein n=1 Tax=Pseudorhodoplanes sp. TaxID=1934341 RepID=UPI003919CF08
MTDRVYLDWNASAPLRPKARAAVLAMLERTGNPSSVHAEGRDVRQAIERARGEVAKLVGADAGSVIFTSGATEANALALSPGWVRSPGDGPFMRLLVSAVEHASVREGGRFDRGRVSQIPVDGRGVIELGALRERLAGPPALVSVMLANNETGVVQPICEVARIVHEAGGLLHVDAVQAPGRIGCDFNALDADLLTLSAHKIGGPRGAGALIRKAGLHLEDTLTRGGGQERGLRAGTENVPGIAGFGAAATEILAQSGQEAAHTRRLRTMLETGLRSVTPDIVFFGEEGERLPNTTCFSHPGLLAETAVIGFDLAGVAVSSGSACSSGKVQPSHVLAAMGVDPALARGAIRVSTGYSTKEADIERLLSAWTKLSESLLKGRKSIAA